jgi:DNA polymerase III epsilon subunit-like protein
MDEEATRIAFVDFEASSLDSGSFTTEVGWAFIDLVDRRIRSGGCLIRPEPSWTRPASAWSAASERLTGISRAMLDRDGVPPAEAVARLLIAVGNRELVSDEPAWDQYWLGQLVEAAGANAGIRLGNARTVITEVAARLGASANWNLPIQHRAEGDALRLAKIYARAAGIEIDAVGHDAGMRDVP